MNDLSTTALHNHEHVFWFPEGAETQSCEGCARQAIVCPTCKKCSLCAIGISPDEIYGPIKETPNLRSTETWRNFPVSDNHHLGLGRERGFTFERFVYGDRVALAHLDPEKYLRQYISRGPR